MADPFQKVKQGQALEITARTMNGVLAAGQDYSRTKLDTGREQTDGTGIDPVFPPQVFNGLADAIPEFSVLAYGPTVRSDAAAVPFEASSSPVFDAALPNANLPFMVSREPVPVGAIGQVVIVGPAVVQVNITDATHTRAVPITGDKSKLTSAAAGGVPILDRETGTGVKWAKVLVGDQSSATVSFAGNNQNFALGGGGAVQARGQYLANVPYSQQFLVCAQIGVLTLSPPANRWAQVGLGIGVNSYANALIGNYFFFYLNNSPLVGGQIMFLSGVVDLTGIVTAGAPIDKLFVQWKDVSSPAISGLTVIVQKFDLIPVAANYSYVATIP